jgi:hypothetical protein
MSDELSAAVAVIDTFETAAVQVAVTWLVGEAERWTEGSLAVQLELINAPVTAGHALPPPNCSVALKTWLLPGAAAVWLTVAVCGPTLIPTVVQVPDPPPQPAAIRRMMPRDTTTKSLDASMVTPPAFIDI